MGTTSCTAPPPHPNYISCKDKCRCAKKGSEPQRPRNRWSHDALEQLPNKWTSLPFSPRRIFGTPV